MITPTYEQQWQKITEAYIRNEIKPLDPHFCFCGTICDGSSDWFINAGWWHNDSHGYAGSDFVAMEKALLSALSTSPSKAWDPESEGYEDAIFNGMTAALEVLRQIHEAKGDPTARPITLDKRQLA